MAKKKKPQIPASQIAINKKARQKCSQSRFLASLFIYKWDRIRNARSCAELSLACAKLRLAGISEIPNTSQISSAVACFAPRNKDQRNCQKRVQERHPKGAKRVPMSIKKGFKHMTKNVDVF